jgi:hypothetical protein
MDDRVGLQVTEFFCNWKVLPVQTVTAEHSASSAHYSLKLSKLPVKGRGC